MNSYRPSFTPRFRFKFHETLGTRPPQAETEYWQVGIVQNVIYEKMTFEYSGEPPIVAAFDKAAVDSNSDRNVPFYHEPVFVKRSELFGGMVPFPNCVVSIMQPVRDIF